MAKRDNPPPPTPAQPLPQPVILEREHIGPLPTPDALAAYEKVLPGLAERIVAMAEKDHQVCMADMEAEIKNRRFAVRFSRYSAAIFSMGVIGVALYSIHKDYPYGAAIVFGLHVAGVCAQLISDSLKR